MEWRKLKNIILMILAALNVALLVLIGGPKLDNYYRERQADREAVVFLEQKGISVAEEIIPDAQALQPQMVERDQEEEARLAARLLGEDVEKAAQGGEVYRYTSLLGVLQFHSDGSFWAELDPTAFPLKGGGESAALSVLELLGFSGEVIDLDNGYVTVRQSWEGASLFNQQATVLWNQEGITEITAGRRLYGAPEPNSGVQTIDRATALIDLYNGLNQMGDVCSRVDAITPGYLSATSLNKLMSLTPVWRVTTDTGAYQLDLVSGELVRVA